MSVGRPRRLSNHLVFDRYINLELFKQKQELQPNGCINWTGITNNAGYGFVGFIYAVSRTGRRDSGMMTAHRLAFMLEYDRAPDTRNVNHTCHNRLCVNPAHLIEGTQQEKMKNMRDDGIKLGGRPYKPEGYFYIRKQNREYKYSEEEIQWYRTSELADIQAKDGITREQAQRRQSAFRRGYKWLAAPYVYPVLKRGRKPKATK